MQLTQAGALLSLLCLATLTACNKSETTASEGTVSAPAQISAVAAVPDPQSNSPVENIRPSGTKSNPEKSGLVTEAGMAHKPNTEVITAEKSIVVQAQQPAAQPFDSASTPGALPPKENFSTEVIAKSKPITSPAQKPAVKQPGRASAPGDLPLKENLPTAVIAKSKPITSPAQKPVVKQLGHASNPADLSPQESHPPEIGTDAPKQTNFSGNPAIGKDKSELCQGCHGERGISLDPMVPNLAGQFDKYIAKQIHDYQTTKRTHQIMSAVAMTIIESELTDIAGYFASMPTMQGDRADHTDGEMIFLNGTAFTSVIPCIKCHGKSGKGLTPNTTTYPVIGGQNKAYLRKQLMDFRGKVRTNSPGGIMNQIAKSLNDTEIEALANYLSAQ